MSNIMVLGANGFLGRHLVKKLDAIPITRKDVDLLDIKSIDNLFKLYKPEILINCVSNLDVNMQNFNTQAFLENLYIFENLFKLKDEIGQVISFGSGAEFDRRNSISNAKEIDIFASFPIDHYGLSKNINARLIYQTKNFYNLRLFGCFHHTENENRLLKKIIKHDIINIEDKFFDYFWLEDIVPVIEYYIKNEKKPKDMNLVYSEKIKMSDFVSLFLKIKGLKKEYLNTSSNFNYTGSSEKIESLNINLQGLREGLNLYEI